MYNIPVYLDDETLQPRLPIGVLSLTDKRGILDFAQLPGNAVLSIGRDKHGMIRELVLITEEQ